MPRDFDSHVWLATWQEVDESLKFFKNYSTQSDAIKDALPKSNASYLALIDYKDAWKELKKAATKVNKDLEDVGDVLYDKFEDGYHMDKTVRANFKRHYTSLESNGNLLRQDITEVVSEIDKIKNLLPSSSNMRTTMKSMKAGIIAAFDEMSGSISSCVQDAKMLYKHCIVEDYNAGTSSKDVEQPKKKRPSSKSPETKPASKKHHHHHRSSRDDRHGSSSRSGGHAS